MENIIIVTKTKKDWYSAEHLIEYPKEYEYAIEIKTNPSNIPNKGSAIFIHCVNKKTTSGCIAIKREKMRKLIVLINDKTKIVIRDIR